MSCPSHLKYGILKLTKSRVYEIVLLASCKKIMNRIKPTMLMIMAVIDLYGKVHHFRLLRSTTSRLQYPR